MAIIAFMLFAGGVVQEQPMLIGLAIVPAAGVFYNLPLLETGRARMGAGQYGLFLEGLGLIEWRAIDALELCRSDLRGGVSQDLHIELKVPVEKALMLDWRRTIAVRSLMRLPWSRPHPEADPRAARHHGQAGTRNPLDAAAHVAVSIAASQAPQRAGSRIAATIGGYDDLARVDRRQGRSCARACRTLCCAGRSCLLLRAIRRPVPRVPLIAIRRFHRCV